MTGTTAHACPHPALDRVLAVWPGDVATRAAPALHALLAERLAADPARAWGSSVLTGDGFPVEITVSTADERLRCTVEPGSARLDPGLRLDLANRTIGGLGARPVPRDILNTIRRLRTGSPRYGAWVGCRFGSDHTAYKVYAEVGDIVRPEPATTRLGLLAPRLPDRPARPRMVGFATDSGDGEGYYRFPDLEPAHVPRLLAAAGLETRAGELLDLVAHAYGHGLPGRLPGFVGVSYSVSATGEPHGVTLFFFARVFWGSDDRIRRCLAWLAPELGWDDSRYRALTADLVGSRDRRTRHGLLGFTVTGHTRPVLSIGLRP